MEIHIPPPDTQIAFSAALVHLRNQYLQDALKNTIDKIDISNLDDQLFRLVPSDSLKSLARHGLRGELVFATPCVLEANPCLLGYYRLLLGFSQKEFYSSRFGTSGFASMEKKGLLSGKNKTALEELCNGLIGSAMSLVGGIGVDRLSREILDDLTLLTIGPQLRGGANVKKGEAGIIAVFQIIHDIVAKGVVLSTANRIEVQNAAGRRVFVEFAQDPDIVIKEEMNNKKFRNIIAVEVKGGTDFSNIHNRVGEAEKSHQKAKASGYVECWTVVNVDKINMEIAKRESPTTNRFFKLSDLKSLNSAEHNDFRQRIVSLIGI